MHHIMLIDRFFTICQPKGLFKYCNEDNIPLLAITCIERGAPMGDALAEHIRTTLPLPHTASVAHDEEQKQVTAQNIISDALRCSVEGSNDFFHRIHNDCQAAMQFT